MSLSELSDVMLAGYSREEAEKIIQVSQETGYPVDGIISVLRTELWETVGKRWQSFVEEVEKEIIGEEY